MKNLKNLILFIVASFLIQSCARNPVTGKREFMLMSESQERAMGLQADPTIIAQYGLYEDEKLQSFINQKGKEMGAISHRPNLDYQFRILDSPVVNAFAVPGGFVYFTRGIMAHFNNEAEFAGVLGHEIGHITARHSARQQSKQILGQGALIGGLILSETVRQNASLASQGLGLLFLKFGRDDESQSDELGVEYSTKIGYDSHEMANFFGVLKRLQQKSGQSIPTFMSTHPDPGNRFNRVHELSDEAQATLDKSSLKVNRNSYLDMIDGIVYGEDPRQGFFENDVFYHPQLKFKFNIPRNWQHVNTPSVLQMADKEGKAVVVLTLAKGNSLQEATQATVQNDGLKVLESKNLTINGNPALAMISDIAPQQAQAGQQQQATPDLRIVTYLISYEGLIYKFHGFTEKALFNLKFDLLTIPMKDFRKLTDPTKLNRQPDRIRIKTVSRNSTLEAALRTFGVPANKLETLAILNNMQLNTQLQAGTKIKTISQ